MSFRKLNADEIEVRVAQVGKGWAQLLLYKNARVDMAILDETVGPFNWQREHYECKGNLFCRVGIAQEVVQNDGMISKEWVWKSDCGAESNTEKEKGEASDSFKRACTNWGIGRELYTAPAIFINVETNEYNGKNQLANKKARFKVSSISYYEDKISGLIIKDQDDKIVYSKIAENKQEIQQEVTITANNSNVNLEKKYQRVKR